MAQRVAPMTRAAVAASGPERCSLLRRGVRLARRKPLGAVGALIVLGMLLMALFAEFIAPFHYNQTHMRDRLKPPSATYILGTDNLGRDIFSRIVYGAPVSMLVSLSAVFMGITLATAVGTISGYAGGTLDTLVQRVVDAWMAFPWLVVLLSMLAIVGPGIVHLTVALGTLVAAGTSRIMRSATLNVKEHTYIEAAQRAGAHPGA